MKKKLLALGLAALLTATQFNVVKASSEENASAKQRPTEIFKQQRENVNIIEKAEHNLFKENEYVRSNTIIKEITSDHRDVTMLEETTEGIGEKGEETQALSTTAGVVEKEIGLNQEIKDELTSENQAIKYKIQLPAEGGLGIDFLSSIKKINIQVEDDKGICLVSENASTSDGESSSSWKMHKNVLPGTYYITISSSTAGNFKFLLSYAKVNTKEIEPNNDISTAQKIEINSGDMKGCLVSNDNSDVYKIEISKRGIVAFGINTFSKIQYEIFDEVGNSLFKNVYQPPTKDVPVNGIILGKLMPGNYYIRVSKVWHEETAYTLNIADINKDGWNKLFGGDYVYYESATNSLKKGWLLYQGAWYYLDDKGVMVKDLQVIDKKLYYFAEGGAMQTGWVKSNESWFYFSDSGAAKSGWLNYHGTWYYLASNGLASTGFQVINDKLYYFGKSGEMKTGWIKEAGKWYYFEGNGAGKVGEWLNWQNNWYYFDGDGTMLTGPWEIKDNRYYFDTNGIMQTGWQKIKDYWYYFNDSGDLKTGWLFYSSHWYYLDNEYGVMLTGTYEIDGVTYTFNSDGTLR